MKQEEIAKLSVEDIKGRIATSQELLNKTRIQHAVAPMENPLQIRFMRRDIARLKTELNKREA
jgi:large subunit ribosomal protein L29